MRFLQAIGGSQVFASILIWSLQSPASAQEPVRPPAQAEDHPRYRFSLLLKSVELGMSKDEVSRLVGEPGFIFEVPPVSEPKPFFNLPGLRSARGSDPGPVTEVWGYGTRDSSALPQYGQVYFGAEGRVRHVMGSAAPSAEVLRIEESELQVLLDAIDRLPWMNSMCSGRYDPALVIQVVNGLQGLGKEGARAVISEYSRLVDQLRGSGLVVILPLLFELGQDDVLHPYVGGTPDQTRVRSRYYPFVFVDGVPFMVLVSGGNGGQVGAPEWHFERLCRDCQFRKTPIVPMGDAESIHANLTSKISAWFKRKPDWLEMHVGRQVILLHKAALSENEQKYMNENHYIAKEKMNDMLEKVFDAKLR